MNNKELIISVRELLNNATDNFNNNGIDKDFSIEKGIEQSFKALDLINIHNKTKKVRSILSSLQSKNVTVTICDGSKVKGKITALNNEEVILTHKGEDKVDIYLSNILSIKVNFN